MNLINSEKFSFVFTFPSLHRQNVRFTQQNMRTSSTAKTHSSRNLNYLEQPPLMALQRSVKVSYSSSCVYAHKASERERH